MYFPYTDYCTAVFLQLIQHIHRRRFYGKIMAAGGSGVIASGSCERTGNDTADTMFTHKDLTGNPAVFIQCFRRHNIFMGSDLEYAVRRRIYNESAGPKMLVPVVPYHIGTRIGLVAEYAAAGQPGKLIKHF